MSFYVRALALFVISLGIVSRAHADCEPMYSLDSALPGSGLYLTEREAKLVIDVDLIVPAQSRAKPGSEKENERFACLTRADGTCEDDGCLNFQGGTNPRCRKIINPDGGPQPKCRCTVDAVE